MLMNYLKDIPTDKTTKLNDLIYAREKPVRDKIGIPIKNPNKNPKTVREIRLGGQIKKKLRKQTKVLR